MVPHSRHGKSVENIDQCAGQHADPVLMAHIKIVGAESNAREPEAGQQHQVMIMEQILFGHKDSRQAEGIADDIICQCRIQIPSVAHAERECRKLQ